MNAKARNLVVIGLLLTGSLIICGHTTMRGETPWKEGVFYDVASDVLSLVYYNSDTATLTLGFRQGAVYEYQGVPASVFYALMATPSKGAFYNERIRGKFKSLRLEVAAGGETI